MALTCNTLERLAFWWVSIAGTVGLLSSMILLLLSAFSRQKRAVLGRLVIGLAMADASAILTIFVPCWAEQRSFFVYPSVTWCTPYVFSVFSLITWSELQSASINISVLFALLGQVHWLERMRWAPAISLLLALLINSATLFDQPQRLDDPSRMPDGLHLDCVPSRWTYLSIGAVLTVVLVLVTAITVYSFITLRRHSPLSSAKRAFSCGRRYLLAFLLTYFVKFLSFPRVSQPRVQREDTCDLWAETFLADGCIFLNGFFNLLAYQGLNFQLSYHRAVVFTSFSSSVESAEMPARRALRTGQPRDQPVDPWQMLWGDDEAHNEPVTMLSLSSSGQGSQSYTADADSLGFQSQSHR